jgi:hypothetical protein
VSLPAATADKSRPEPDCRQLASSVAEPGVTLLCQGQAAMRARNEAATGSQERRAYLTSAARLLSASSGRLRDLDLRVYALESLARMYGAAYLNEPRQSSRRFASWHHCCHTIRARFADSPHSRKTKATRTARSRRCYRPGN